MYLLYQFISYCIFISLVVFHQRFFEISSSLRYKIACCQEYLITKDIYHTELKETDFFLYEILRENL